MSSRYLALSFKKGKCKCADLGSFPLCRNKWKGYLSFLCFACPENLARQWDDRVSATCLCVNTHTVVSVVLHFFVTWSPDWSPDWTATCRRKGLLPGMVSRCPLPTCKPATWWRLPRQAAVEHDADITRGQWAAGLRRETIPGNNFSSMSRFSL